MRVKPRLDGDLFQRSERAIAHGALTNSKRASCFVKGVYPAHLSRGYGAFVWDTNGHRYIDFICGLGSNLIGYAHDEVVSAVKTAISNGATLSLGTDTEIKAAERVKELFPFIELLRFLKTGSDACTAACIIARAYTGREEILSEGYHGWHPEFTALTPPAHGCKYHGDLRKLTHLDHITSRTAAVIVEPVITDYSKDRINYLERLRSRCDETGALLIFDEVITGLRIPGYSIAAATNIRPDLVCLGKALAGGLPLSVVGGKKEIMECDYFVSSTFAGDTVSLSAAIATIDLLQKKLKLADLWERGDAFTRRFNTLSPDIKIEGYPTRGVFTATTPEAKALFFQECCKAGLLVGPSFFFAFPHIELIEEALHLFSDVFLKLKTGNVTLEGEMPQIPYAQKVRSQ